MLKRTSALFAKWSPLADLHYPGREQRTLVYNYRQNAYSRFSPNTKNFIQTVITFIVFPVALTKFLIWNNNIKDAEDGLPPLKKFLGPDSFNGVKCVESREPIPQEVEDKLFEDLILSAQKLNLNFKKEN